jgi:hypothetical protein
MSKYGKDNRQRALRIALKLGQLAAEEVSPPRDTYEEESQSLWSESIFLTVRDIRSNINGELVEFAVIVHEQTASGKFELLCIDSCHTGVVHLHPSGHKLPTEIIATVKTSSDLDNARKIAIERSREFIERVVHNGR